MLNIKKGDECMKKKIVLGLVSAAFILGAGTAVYGATTDTEEGLLNFKKMLPYMQEMHPDFSEQELEDMYNTCHGSDSEQNTQTQQTTNMMNRF